MTIPFEPYISKIETDLRNGKATEYTYRSSLEYLMESFERGIDASKVPEEVWEFKVGGYQVCEKWLKDCMGRVLSGKDITHCQRVVFSLKETIRLMKEIDKSIVKWPIE